MGTQPLPARMTTSLRPDVWLLEKNIKGKMSRENLQVVAYDSVCAAIAVVKDGMSRYRTTAYAINAVDHSSNAV
jgi:hypothetical protein